MRYTVAAADLCCATTTDSGEYSSSQGAACRIATHNSHLHQSLDHLLLGMCLQMIGEIHTRMQVQGAHRALHALNHDDNWLADSSLAANTSDAGSATAAAPSITHSLSHTLSLPLCASCVLPLVRLT